VPEGADIDEIEAHLTKHKRDYIPQTSTHERAKERWQRFVDAQDALEDAENREKYDVLRDRFGPERGTEVYEKWDVRGRQPEDVKTLDPVRDLGLPPEEEPDGETDDSTDRRQQRQSETDSTTDSAFQQRRRTDQSRQRREYDVDVDLDSTKTHSTRSPDDDRDDDATRDDGEGTRFDRVLDHLNMTTAIAIREATTALSTVEFAVAAYLVYVVVVELVAPAVASAVGGTPLIDPVTAGTTLGLGYLLVSRYLDRFAGDGAADGPTASPGRRIFRTVAEPELSLVVPVALTVLLGLGFLLGGGAGTLFLFGLALLSVYARFRLVADRLPLPAWGRYAEPAGAVAVAVLFLAVFVATDGSVGVGEVTSSSGAPLVAVVVFATLVAIAAPVAPVAAALRGE
jgi:hypothetical protein